MRSSIKVLLLANPHTSEAEGAGNVSRELEKQLAKKCSLTCISPRDWFQVLRHLLSARPDVVHSVQGPSRRTFRLLWLLHLLRPETGFFATLLQPGESLKLLQPPRYRFIVILAQSPEPAAGFSAAGFPVHFIPNGVDLDRFHADAIPMENPLSADSGGKRLLLHVGHIRSSRNLKLLADLNLLSDWQVMVVGSPRFPAEPELLNNLKESGCLVEQRFISDLPGLYCMADAYIFPVEDLSGAIHMPLSVLEALACGLPVLSTRFAALPHFFPPGGNVHYFSTAEEAERLLETLPEHTDRTEPSRQLERFSWSQITSEIIQLYHNET